MNELQDRVPEFADAQEQNVIPQEGMAEELDRLLASFNRKQKRKIFKPTFSSNARLALRRKPDFPVLS